MKIEYPVVKGLIIALVLAVVGFVIYSPLSASGLDGRSLFAGALLVGALLGGLSVSVRLPAEGPSAAASPRAASRSGNGERKTVFVGNLAYRASQDDVRDLFRDFGEVYSVRLMTDRVTRRPRGFGFVEMDASNAEEAIRRLNGYDFLGRELKVNEGKQRDQRVNQAA